MARSSGPGQGAGAADTEAAFLERLAGVLAEWQRRLAAGAGPAEVALVSREAGELRQHAQSRGFGATAQLVYLENIIQQTPHALAQAVQALTVALRVAGVRGNVASGTIRLDSSALPPRVPSPGAAGRSPSAPPEAYPSPLIVSRDPTGVVSPPSLLLGQPSVVASPPAALSPRARSEPTMVSQQRPELRPGASQPPPAVARPPEGREPPVPQRPRVLFEPSRGAQPAQRPPSPLPERDRSLAEPPEARLPDSLPQPGPPPSLLQKTFLGLRAFSGKKGSGPDLPLTGASRDAGANPGLFGFRGLGSEAPRPGSSPGRVSSRPGVGRSSRPGSRPPAAGGQRSSGQDRESWRDSESQEPIPRREPAVPRWFYLLIGLVGLLGIGTTVAIVVYGRRAREPREPLPVAVSTPVGAPSPSGPLPVANPSEPSVEPMTKAIHEHGAETPELHALLEMQSKLAAHCRDDPTTCGRGWTPLAKEALTPIDLPKDFMPTAPQGPLPAWLRRLKLPADMPVQDEAALRVSFDFKTKNIAGRQAFQALLFNCAAYADIFESTLIKYGAPTWLTAVVYQESACRPGVSSDVGARGLWQFMPESARMYGLRVVEGDVDERLNPIKSTDAAIHFLTDLQRKLGAWDLTLAAYNMGPFAVVARLAQIGQNAGFWDLVHAHVLPEETASYVPAIESYALILDNLSRLQFSRDGKRLESTAEILVKPGVRLSLLARAASTNTLHIRELNPEFLRDVVPDGETTARVPDAEAHRAETFLGSWSPDDSRDTCVPEDFDWGAKEFETSRYAKACAQTHTPQ